MCATEWTYGRIICPACGEEAVEKLAIYTASQFDHVRVEACDTCRSYVKSIDLSQDGRLIPEVDELTSLGLDLWAVEEGYARIEPGLAGL